MIEYSDGTGASRESLKKLWKKAFADEDGFIDTFFSAGFSPERCRTAIADGTLAGMLFWFDCSVGGQKTAYIYGVATDPRAQGQGIATGLMENVHSLLSSCGYSSAILVPGSQMLFRFYEKRGYRVVSTVTECRVPAAQACRIDPIDVQTFARLRHEMLPPNGVEQLGGNLRFLEQIADCYQGEGFIAAVSRDDPSHCMEILGDEGQIAHFAGALGCEQMFCRMPGTGRQFAMGIRLDGADWVEPIYFGLAFD